MFRQRQVKIVATLGPASGSPEIIRDLVSAGADVFRLNMSHMRAEALAERVELIRAIEEKLGHPVGILVDLQGPKLRVGNFATEDGVMIESGARFTLDSDPAPGDSQRVCLPHPEILGALAPGHALILDDGKLRFVVEAVEKDKAIARVVVGGVLKSRKGVSLPDTIIPVSAMTEKDYRDAAAARAAGADWIALSFVQRAEDIADLRRIVGDEVRIIAKIEKPQAVERLEDILEAADGLMVARGDLGVEMPLEKVPGLQKRIIRLARRLGKPVIVATQMLESMITAPTPTRAEVSDVATAVFEGADAVMLSAESASGAYPREAVAMMDRIAREVESDPLFPALIANQRSAPEITGADAIAASARQIAETLELPAICAWSFSGATALRIARERPRAAILALSPRRETARALSLVWGIHPIITKDASDINDMAMRGAKFAMRAGIGKPGQRIVVVAGIPFGTPGATNIVRIAHIPGAQPGSKS
ncbi:MAG: pyruvate kinase [Proteobacteria bacterium]|nr:pyruvate kinase [Pseudomonadota bacterium]